MTPTGMAIAAIMISAVNRKEPFISKDIPPNAIFMGFNSMRMVKRGSPAPVHCLGRHREHHGRNENPRDAYPDQMHRGLPALDHRREQPPAYSTREHLVAMVAQALPFPAPDANEPSIVLEEAPLGQPRERAAFLLEDLPYQLRDALLL